MEPHNSYVKLISIKRQTVTIHASGPCTECEKNCIEVAFKERLPHIKVVIKKAIESYNIE